jgi:hypothetical protein
MTWAEDLLVSASPKEPLASVCRRIAEAAKLAARANRDVRYHDVFAGYQALLKRRLEAERAELDASKALPAITGDPDVNRLAASTTISDALAGLLRGQDLIEAEMQARRSMTPEQIAERRAALAKGGEG